MYKYLLFISIVFISACSSMPFELGPPSKVSVLIADQDRIRFTGKGAGAGLMMSASMGSVGIAIGVAIDEGIAKEIHESYVAQGGNFGESVGEQTLSWVNDFCRQEKEQAVCDEEYVLVVKVYYYGFINGSGDDDPIKPSLDIGFEVNGAKEARFDLKRVDKPELLIPLDVAKVDGEQAEKVLLLGFQELLGKFESSLLEE